VPAPLSAGAPDGARVVNAEHQACDSAAGLRRNGASAPGPGARAARRLAGRMRGQRLRMTSRTRRAVSLGVRPTLTPAFSRASFFAWAVPDEPVMIAPLSRSMRASPLIPEPPMPIK